MTTLLALFSLLPTQVPSLDADFEVALGAAGLTTKTARFDPNLLGFFRQGEFTTTLYNAAHENPWRIPFFAENLRSELAPLASRPHESLTAGMRMLGFQVRRTLVGNPNAAEEEASKKPGALAATLADWKAKGFLTGAIPSTAGIPENVQSAAALLLSVIPKAAEARRLALKDLTDLPGAFNRLAAPAGDTIQGAEFDARLGIFRKVDLGYFAAGAFDLVHAVQEAQSRLATTPETEKYDFRVQTRWGWIALSGAGNAQYGAEPVVLLIDTGGDDRYLNLPATRSAANALSIVIDTAGNDQYLSDSRLVDTPLAQWGPRTGPGQPMGPAGALMGYAMLIDRQGNDLYRSHRPGLASSKIGFSTLIDLAGDDQYDAYADSQGFATFGWAMLEDLGGKDVYRGFNQVQGVGQTMGFGFLVDRGGNDEYIADDSLLDFPSAQSPQHNVSMAQGAGNGRRADYLDSHSLAGGIGLLMDQGGDDQYSCGVFGQGVGYWMGTGLLFDTEGSDRYTGQWYVQGASAHFALGGLFDEAGDDQYVAKMNMAQGAGHDLGTGYLQDSNGNDRYEAPNLSLGAGNANGIGIFIDLRGNDGYTSTGITLGSAAEAPKSSLRTRALCLGVFLDLGGDDTFPSFASWAKNATRTPNWKDRGPSPAESQLGIFWDR